MIFTKVSIEVNVILLDLWWELIISLEISFQVASLACTILKTLDTLIELVLEYLDCLNGIMNHKVCKSRVKLPQLIYIDIESGLSSNDVFNSLTDLILVQILIDQILHI